MKIYWIKAQAPQRVLALVKYLGIKAEFVEIDLMAGGLKTPEYAALNPNMKVPTLIDGDLVLWESEAIMVHLCIKTGSDMWPGHTPAEQVQVLRWMSWNNCHWADAVSPFYFEHVVKATFGIGPPDTTSREDVRNGLCEIRQSPGWPLGGPQFRSVRKADDCRLPTRLDGELLARIGNADGSVSPRRSLARRVGAYPSVGRSLANQGRMKSTERDCRVPAGLEQRGLSHHVAVQ